MISQIFETYPHQMWKNYFAKEVKVLRMYQALTKAKGDNLSHTIDYSWCLRVQQVKVHNLHCTFHALTRCIKSKPTAGAASVWLTWRLCTLAQSFSTPMFPGFKYLCCKLKFHPRQRGVGNMQLELLHTGKERESGRRAKFQRASSDVETLVSVWKIRSQSLTNRWQKHWLDKQAEHNMECCTFFELAGLLNC